MERKIKVFTIGAAALVASHALGAVAFASPLSSGMRVERTPVRYCTSDDVLSAYAAGARLHCAFVERREYSYAVPSFEGGGAFTVSGVNGI